MKRVVASVGGSLRTFIPVVVDFQHLDGGLRAHEGIGGDNRHLAPEGELGETRRALERPLAQFPAALHVPKDRRLVRGGCDQASAVACSRKHRSETKIQNT
eukprot:757238-Prorocentrum_minimum.AAC.2